MSETLSMPIRWLCLSLTLNFTRRCHQARKVEHFDFDLTCDITGDPEVIKICYPSTVFPGLPNAALIFRISPVSEIRGGLEISPPPPVCQYQYDIRVIKISSWARVNFDLKH